MATPSGWTVTARSRRSAAARTAGRVRPSSGAPLGAVVGGLIGAVAGGGKGALIGGAVGAGVGAGTVIVQGRDRFDLQRGTELTFTSGDPRYQR